MTEEGEYGKGGRMVGATKGHITRRISCAPPLTHRLRQWREERRLLVGVTLCVVRSSAVAQAQSYAQGE